ncbi:MAG: hypothetical protein QXE31_02685 [Candidatus Woesearchaeota archaeon]
MALKEYAIVIAIMILFTSFIMFSIEAIYPRPDFNYYCNTTYDNSFNYEKNQENCTYDYKKEQECFKNQGIVKYDYDEKGCRYVSECDYCQKNYNNALKNYNLVLFYILAIIGVAAIIFGIYYKIEFIGTGFMFSGIFLLFFGTTQTFNDLNRYLRPIVLFLELSLILFIAYKKIVKNSLSIENKKTRK